MSDMFIAINTYCSLTLFMVVFSNEALGYETNTQCWRHKTDVESELPETQQTFSLNHHTVDSHTNEA